MILYTPPFIWKDISVDGFPSDDIPVLVATAVPMVVVVGVLQRRDGRWLSFFEPTRPVRQDFTHWIDMQSSLEIKQHGT